MRDDEPWSAREHDELVEPMYAGLRAHERFRERAESDADDARGARRLWLAISAVAASLVVRAWTLL
jgi:hypothetical protein